MAPPFFLFAVSKVSGHFLVSGKAQIVFDLTVFILGHGGVLSIRPSFCNSACDSSNPMNMATNVVSLVCVLHYPIDAPQPTDGSVSVVALNEAGKVRVTWSRPTLGPGQVITGYSVQYRRRGSTFYTTRLVSGSIISYTITNLNLGAVYEVRVASVDPLGLSGHCCGNGKQVATYNCECSVMS